MILIRKTDEKWEVESVQFKGLPISMIHYDTYRMTWWVGLSIKHWGPKLFRSEDQGENWKETPVPQFDKGMQVKKGVPATLKLIWSALATQSGRLWLGTEPGGLFFSDDHGATFELCRGLWNHESRPDHWFGGGRNQAGIHSIVQDPRDDSCIYVGVSCAGVFKTEDNGISWEAKNKGLKAFYLPNPAARYGHDPHAMKINATDPKVIWQQNHCGVFRSIDAGDSWTDITDNDEWGRYGFPIVIDHQNPDRAWIIPAESDEQRVAKDLRLVVCHTDDGGKSWRKITSGLPQENCFDLVFRHAFDRQEQRMAFGTTTGHFYISENDGEDWVLALGHLAPVHVVKFAPDA